MRILNFWKIVSCMELSVDKLKISIWKIYIANWGRKFALRENTSNRKSCLYQGNSKLHWRGIRN